MKQSDVKLIKMSDIEGKSVDWLWHPYIPYGKITIVQGDPGEGKTTFVLQLAALLSRGEPLPNEIDPREPIHIIYQTAEDGLEDTIKPRLERANADCSRIHVIDDSQKPLSMLDERIEQAIMQTNAKMVVLDPIQGFLGVEVDMHRANEIRPVLKHLSQIAERHQCAILLIGHMNKANKAKSTYRGLGSIDFQAMARSVLIVGRIQNQPTVRVIAHGKSSLAPEGVSFAFQLQEQGFCWLGEYDITVEELLDGVPCKNKVRQAELLLQELLEDGAVQQSEIECAVKEYGIAKRTIDQAKKNLGVNSKKQGLQWWWVLPEKEGCKDAR